LSEQQAVNITKYQEPYNALHNFADGRRYAFMLHGHEWRSASHLYHALMHAAEDGALAAQIRDCEYPEIARAKALSVHLRNPKYWQERKEDAMRLAVLCKFIDNDDLQALLLSTGERLLLYLHGDGYWSHIKGFPDSNVMGRILMEVRALLQQPGQAEARLMILLGQFREQLHQIR